MSSADQVPELLTAGDSGTWLRELADYPSPDWTLTYLLQNQGGNYSVVAIAENRQHRATIAADTSAAYKPGRYAWFARVSKGSEVRTVEKGWITIAPNPATAGTYDHRSWARRTLDALEARLEGRASADQLSMSIGGRSISRIPLPELLQWRDRLRMEVRAEDPGKKAGASRDIKVRLKRA